MSLVVRTAGDPLALAATVRQAIHTLDPTAVITEITTLDRQLDDRIAQRRFQTWLLGLFAARGHGCLLIETYLLKCAVARQQRPAGSLIVVPDARLQKLPSISIIIFRRGNQNANGIIATVAPHAAC